MNFFAQELLRLSESHATRPLANRKAHCVIADQDYERLVRITSHLVEWRKASDEITGAFLVNGIREHRRGYFAEIHARFRRANNIEWTPPKYARIERLRELIKMGATFDELYLKYWDEPHRGQSRATAYRACRLAKLIKEISK